MGGLGHASGSELGGANLTQPADRTAPQAVPSAVNEELAKVGLAPAPSENPVGISLVIPAFNEERRLATTLVGAWDYLKGAFSSYEILLIDDGSTDATADLGYQFTRLNPAIRVLRTGRNRGKGAAVRLGVTNARGRLLLYADADGASRIDHLARLLAAVDEGADVAVGSRALTAPGTRVRKLWHRHAVGRIFNLLANLLAAPGIRDTQCGFKLFRAEAARAIFARQAIDGYAFDVEILMLAFQLGHRVVEVPIDWTHIPGSKVRLWRDPPRMLLDLFRIALRRSLGARGDGR